MTYGARQCAGLGLIAGAAEVVHLATSIKLPLGFVRFAILGVVDLLVMALIAGVLGLLVGAIVQLVPPDPEEGWATPELLAFQAAICGGLLTGLALWQGAAWVWIEGEQPIGAAAMAAMPLGFGGVVYFNARFWFRRGAAGRAPRLPWLAMAALASGIVVSGAAIAYPLRDTGGVYALDGDQSVVIITVDGLRRDQVGFHGGPQTPGLDALARRAVVFDNAVTPTPGSRAANATVLAGLHPLRHRVLDERHTLALGFRTLFEVLAAEGWATAGFVSSRVASAGSGLDQGFRVFDDDFLPAIAGVGRINVVGHALRWVTSVADPDESWSLSHRTAEDTAGRFEVWLEDHADLPFAAWVHFSDPHRAAAGAGDVAEAVAAVDRAVAQIRAALRHQGVVASTLVVVVGTHGELLGAHGGQGNRTLFDNVIRVPLLLAGPGLSRTVARPAAQVRLMDIPNTVLDWLELDPMDDSEGLVLTDYGSGERSATVWCALVGQDLDGDWVLGMRNNGVKYMRSADGAEAMYDLVGDPGEATDRTASQATALEGARRLLASDAVALERLVGGR